jgi:hypothetical protein
MTEGVNNYVRLRTLGIFGSYNRSLIALLFATSFLLVLTAIFLIHVSLMKFKKEDK